MVGSVGGREEVRVRSCRDCIAMLAQSEEPCGWVFCGFGGGGLGSQVWVSSSWEVTEEAFVEEGENMSELVSVLVVLGLGVST